MATVPDNNYTIFTKKIEELEKKIKNLEENQNNSQIKIQSGTHHEEFWKQDNQYNWINTTDKGFRNVKIYINFKESYKKPPHVLVSLAGLDCEYSKNTRVYVSALDISICGFNLEMATFGDSKIYYVKANWVAYGQ